MAQVKIGNRIVDVPESLLRQPELPDETTGAPAALRFAVGATEKPEDQLATLRARGYEAFRGDDGRLYYREPQAQRLTRVNPRGLDIGDVAGAAPELASTVGSVLGGLAGGLVGAPTGPGAAATAMVGSGLGAAGGKEAAQWLGRQMFGTQDTRTGLERLADVGKEAALGAAAEGAGRLVGSGVGAIRQAMGPSAEQQAMAAIADKAGIPLMASDVTQNPLVQAGEHLLHPSPVAPRMAVDAFDARQGAAIQRTLEHLAPSRGGWPRYSALKRPPEGYASESMLDDANRLFNFVPERPPEVGPLMKSPDQEALADRLYMLAKVEKGKDQERSVMGFLKELGQEGDTFSPTRYLQNWQKLDPRAKWMVGSLTNLREPLNALTSVIATVGQRQKRFAASDPLTGKVLGTLGLAGGWIGGGPAGAAAAAVAPSVLAKLYTNQKFVNWLATAAKNPGSWSKHMTKLATMAQGDEAVGELFNALVPQAQAGEWPGPMPAVLPQADAWPGPSPQGAPVAEDWPGTAPTQPSIAVRSALPWPGDVPRFKPVADWPGAVPAR